MKISIIVVSLNAGDELKNTVGSIIAQTYKDIEVIVKDGGSSDGSVDMLPRDARVRLLVKPDIGIYDAMNQALDEACGDYCIFINCGDYLYDTDVIERMSRYATEPDLVIYGDIYDRQARARVASNPRIDDFACFRNVPCHQACMYDRRLLTEHPFDISYRVRADYEQFLWCYYKGKAKFIYTGEIVSSYMGGGFSDDKKNKRISALEHESIISEYMTPEQIRSFKLRLALTLAPLRSAVAKNPVTGGLYNRLKAGLYSKRNFDR